jgi:two-component system CheB/CheR fusion protein
MKTKTIKKKSTAKKSPVLRSGDKDKINSFPIVAIGASAGGLEAMMELLQHLPPDTGMAFIYVQHLSPDHKSMLTEILSKKTRMKVQEIDDMDKIKPNNVFVIPYNKGIEVTDGRIKLIPRSESVTAMSIDILFSSLAHAQKERVIGIVLSGSATDGTVGIKAIKHEGGLTFAQDDTAKFSSMPHSAISAGVVDFVLSPKEIALELERLSKHPFVKSAKDGVKPDKEDLIENNNPDLITILNQIHKLTGVDFSVYKMNTIKRRIIRRMLLYKIVTLKAYAKLLTQKNEEIDILHQDLLINVTSFFRDTETHKYLKENLLPKLLKRKNVGETLRIWVPACATGEEAYSIAMMLLEIQGSQTSNTPVQIFATDLSENSITKARLGVYSKQELETVSPKRIQRFFSKTDGGFRVNKALRDICVFATHNILRDPPFSRLDFVSCCNLFIYLDIAAQKKAVNTFHFALNNEGFLMLGKSENISHSPNLFTSFNKKYKIFSRKINSGTRKLPELLPRFAQQSISGKNIKKANKSKTQNPKVIRAVHHKGLDEAIDAVLISEFMPASVVINYQMEIVQFRGNTDLFLTHPKGKATFNILKMARPGIAFELRNAISKVIKTKERVRKSGIEVKLNSESKMISVEIVPLEIEADENLLLILFTEQEKTEIYFDQLAFGKINSKNIEAAKDRRIKKLEEELAAAKADALDISQEQEAFTEELQSAHEEVVSSNEELQTVNEELETSKEEIESANEELTTTNQELQTRNDLLNESYEYSEAIVSTMHEPMLVLGKDLRVKSANKSFYKKFGVNEEQTEGVLLYDLGNKQWNIPALRELLEDIIPKNSHFYNYEVKHTFLHLGEKIMSLNASRIIQKTHREHLILLIISDITEVRQLLLEKELREKELLSKEILERTEEKLTLEKAVNERTQELKEANESLEEKNEALQNMNKELEAFNYVSSHDLQEPLRKIQTFASRILEKENQNLTDNGKKHFRLMLNSAARMQQLIRDLLAFSRITAAERKFEDINLNSIIEDVKAEFKEAIEQKLAVIEVIDTCEVKTIPFQFRQLMYNLISNALKFSNPDIPPRIKITSKNIKYNKLNLPQNNKDVHTPKEYCHINITDNGIGFEKKFSEKIFEVFQKLHGKEEYTGTGIGLAIVKKIVDNHNGIITAKGELNKGASFDIYIPASLKK